MEPKVLEEIVRQNLHQLLSEKLVGQPYDPEKMKEITIEFLEDITD